MGAGHHSRQDPERAEAAEPAGDDHVEDSVVDTRSGGHQKGSAAPGSVLGRHQQRWTAVDEGAVEVDLRLTARQAGERTEDPEQIGVALPQRPGRLQGGYGDLGVEPGAGRVDERLAVRSAAVHQAPAAAHYSVHRGPQVVPSDSKRVREVIARTGRQNAQRSIRSQAGGGDLLDGSVSAESNYRGV
jgi:hypothetical protein